VPGATTGTETEGSTSGTQTEGSTAGTTGTQTEGATSGTEGATSGSTSGTQTEGATAGSTAGTQTAGTTPGTQTEGATTGTSGGSNTGNTTGTATNNDKPYVVAPVTTDDAKTAAVTGNMTNGETALASSGAATKLPNTGSGEQGGVNNGVVIAMLLTGMAILGATGLKLSKQRS
jgi:hypothetical protein